MFWTAKEKCKKKVIERKYYYFFNNWSVLKQKSLKKSNANKKLEIMSQNNAIFGVYNNAKFHENIHYVRWSMKSMFNPLKTNDLQKWPC